MVFIQLNTKQLYLNMEKCLKGWKHVINEKKEFSMKKCSITNYERLKDISNSFLLVTNYPKLFNLPLWTFNRFFWTLGFILSVCVCVWVCFYVTDLAVWTREVSYYLLLRWKIVPPWFSPPLLQYFNKLFIRFAKI